jgi:hypothetical protein
LDHFTFSRHEAPALRVSLPQSAHYNSSKSTPARPATLNAPTNLAIRVQTRRGGRRPADLIFSHLSCFCYRSEKKLSNRISVFEVHSPPIQGFFAHRWTTCFLWPQHGHKILKETVAVGLCKAISVTRCHRPGPSVPPLALVSRLSKGSIQQSISHQRFYK